MTMNPMLSETKFAHGMAIAALITVAITSLVLDQVTKIHAEDALMVWQDEVDTKLWQGRRYPIASVGSPVLAPDKFYVSLNTNYVRNHGAAWGFLSGVSDSIRVPFFYAVTLIAVIVIGIYLKTTPPSHRLARYGLTLILSGAVGNSIDRIRLGYVIDWIDVHWNVMGWRYYFPNFNIADSVITVGVSFLLVDLVVFDTLRAKKRANDAKSAPPAGATEVT